MPKTLTCKIAAIFLSLVALLAGCSDDKATQQQNPDGNPIQLVDVAAIVESVAPPEYTTPVGAAAAVDSAWMYGDYPLLENVFGSHEPEALYSNINDFKLSHDILTSTMLVDGDGDLITGTYVDSHLVDMGEDPIMMHFTAIVTALSGPTPIPLAAQEVVGEEVDLEYLVNVTTEEMPNGVIRIGFTLNDTIQTICQWDEGTSGDDEQTRLVYASLDPRDSSFTFRGLGYCQHPISPEWPEGDRFCWAYNITADASSDFSYRMGYTSEGEEWSFRYGFLGGGNKDTEFALKYRSYHPVDTTVCDSTQMLEQVFGPNYSEGVGLITDYDDYLDDDLILPYSAIPQAMIPNPWED